MNIICAIAKNEELYIKDWVEWHLNLGFDHIYIYDNSDNEEKALKNYYINEKLTYIPVYGIKEKSFQIKCYNEFYNSHDFDWCAFIDLDEYIVLNKWNSIGEFLKDEIFSNTNVVRLNWHTYGDDNMIERDMSIPVYEALKNIVPHQYNTHGKEIVRGNVPGLKIESTHWCNINGTLPKQIMPDGKETFGKVGGLRNCNEAYINHYITKTLSEYVKQKLYRGDACVPERNLGLGYYWDVNTKTTEKINWLKNNGYI